MKKIFYSSIVVSLLVVGCFDGKTSNEKMQNDVAQKSEQKVQTVTPVQKQESEKTVAKVEETKKAQPASQEKKVIKASASKGQKIFARKLKEACGFNGGVFAKKHTQDEWQKIYKDGKFKDEIKNICPNVDIKVVKDKYVPDLVEFVIQFASDSGNIPSC